MAASDRTLEWPPRQGPDPQARPGWRRARGHTNMAAWALLAAWLALGLSGCGRKRAAPNAPATPSGAAAGSAPQAAASAASPAPAADTILLRRLTAEGALDERYALQLRPGVLASVGLEEQQQPAYVLVPGGLKDYLCRTQPAGFRLNEASKLREGVRLERFDAPDKGGNGDWRITPITAAMAGQTVQVRPLAVSWTGEQAGSGAVRNDPLLQFSPAIELDGSYDALRAAGPPYLIWSPQERTLYGLAFTFFQKAAAGFVGNLMVPSEEGVPAAQAETAAAQAGPAAAAAAPTPAAAGAGAAPGASQTVDLPVPASQLFHTGPLVGALAADQKALIVLDLATGGVLCTLALQTPPEQVILAHGFGFCINYTGRTTAIYDLRQGKLLDTLDSPFEPGGRVELTPDGWELDAPTRYTTEARSLEAGLKVVAGPRTLTVHMRLPISALATGQKACWEWVPSPCLLVRANGEARFIPQAATRPKSPPARPANRAAVLAGLERGLASVDGRLMKDGQGLRLILPAKGKSPASETVILDQERASRPYVVDLEPPLAHVAVLSADGRQVECRTIPLPEGAEALPGAQSDPLPCYRYADWTADWSWRPPLASPVSQIRIRADSDVFIARDGAITRKARQPGTFRLEADVETAAGAVHRVDQTISFVLPCKVAARAWSGGDNPTVWDAAGEPLYCLGKNAVWDVRQAAWQSLGKGFGSCLDIVRFGPSVVVLADGMLHVLDPESWENRSEFPCLEGKHLCALGEQVFVFGVGKLAVLNQKNGKFSLTQWYPIAGTADAGTPCGEVWPAVLRCEDLAPAQLPVIARERGGNVYGSVDVRRPPVRLAELPGLDRLGKTGATPLGIAIGHGLMLYESDGPQAQGTQPRSMLVYDLNRKRSLGSMPFPGPTGTPQDYAAFLLNTPKGLIHLSQVSAPAGAGVEVRRLRPETLEAVTLLAFHTDADIGWSAVQDNTLQVRLGPAIVSIDLGDAP